MASEVLYTDAGQPLRVMAALSWPPEWQEVYDLHSWAEGLGLNPGMTNGEASDVLVSLTPVASFTLDLFGPVPVETMRQIEALCDGRHPAMLVACPAPGNVLTFDVFESGSDALAGLVEAQGIAGGLPRTKVAALAKTCLLELGGFGEVIGRLDAITDGDPELG